MYTELRTGPVNTCSKNIIKTLESYVKFIQSKYYRRQKEFIGQHRSIRSVFRALLNICDEAN